MKTVGAPSVCLLLLLSACGGAGSKPVPVPATELSLAWSRLGSVQAGVVTSELELADLVREFDRHDDTYGAWLATFELCRYHTRSTLPHRGDAACDEALQRAKLTGKRSAVFDTAIQLYFYRGDPGYLAQAQDHADREQDRQVLTLARGEYAQLRLPEDEHPQVAVRAYQYYWYGKQHADEQALGVAHQLFLESDNVRGLADVLFLRARLAARRGEAQDARKLANRALHVLGALGDEQKQRRVRAWMNDELVTL
jgi:hypothetical protein